MTSVIFDPLPPIGNKSNFTSYGQKLATLMSVTNPRNLPSFGQKLTPLLGADVKCACPLPQTAFPDDGDKKCRVGARKNLEEDADGGQFRGDVSCVQIFRYANKETI